MFNFIVFSSNFQIIIFQFKDYVVYSFSCIFEMSVSTSFINIILLGLVFEAAFSLVYVYNMHANSPMTALSDSRSCLLFLPISHFQPYMGEKPIFQGHPMSSGSSDNATGNFEFSSSQSPVSFANLALTLCEFLSWSVGASSSSLCRPGS